MTLITTIKYKIWSQTVHVRENNSQNIAILGAIIELIGAFCVVSKNKLHFTMSVGMLSSLSK